MRGRLVGVVFLELAEADAVVVGVAQLFCKFLFLTPGGDPVTFYDPEFAPSQIVVRYAIGDQEREVVVLTNGHSLEEHSNRLEALTESPTPGVTYVTWPIASGGAVAIRVDSIIALESSDVENGL